MLHIIFKCIHLQESGRSALFFAAEEGQDVAVSILLAYGADPHLTDVVALFPF